MEPQVDFFRHGNTTNGLMDSTDPTAVLSENFQLREENQRLLEQFCQQIHVSLRHLNKVLS